jgi:heme/copper-type cytochrome/quinol oxidase subunit 3
MSRPVLDVRHLDAGAFGARDPLWWGVTLLMCIEGSVFGLLVASTLYLRGLSDAWPPTLLPPSWLQLAGLDLALLSISAVPMHLTNRAAHRSSVAGMKRWLLVTIVAGVAVVVVRGYEAWLLPFRWDSHAYGSLLWMFLFLHSVHVITGVLENTLFLSLLTRGPVLEEKHLTDLTSNGLYWYFVVVSWLPCFAVLFLDPGLWPQWALPWRS